MISKISQIKRASDDNSHTFRDGVVFVVKTDKGIVEHQISGTEWSSRLTEQQFDVFGVQLTKEEIETTNKLLFG